ncbi:hypothetical protein M8J77_015982 [Diaphorina citri]|nr:hypothetical protein M8J77_015982 [Diaphorina citri]
MGKDNTKNYKEKFKESVEKQEMNGLIMNVRKLNNLREGILQNFTKKSKVVIWKNNKVSYSLLDSNGVELFDESDMLKRWNEYCTERYDDTTRSDYEDSIEIASIDDKDVPTITTEEIHNLILNLRKNLMDVMRYLQNS